MRCGWSSQRPSDRRFAALIFGWREECVVLLSLLTSVTPSYLSAIRRSSILLLVEYTKVAFRTVLGFVIMGFIGFFVKLICTWIFTTHPARACRQPDVFEGRKEGWVGDQ